MACFISCEAPYPSSLTEPDRTPLPLLAMEKIKQVLSSNKHEDNDLTAGQGDPAKSSTHATRGFGGEGSHLADANSAGNVSRQPGVAGANAVEQNTGSLPSGEGAHPIYDQFTGHGHHTTASGQSTRTADQAPHFSNTTNLNQSPQSSTLSPTTTDSGRPAPGDGMSTASIKSGVQGYPQSSSISNQPENLGQHQGLGATTLPDRTATGESQHSSHIGRDTAAGAGAVGGAALAGHELNRRHDNSGSQEPHVTTASNREFPLAGGVTSRQPEGNTFPHSNTTGVHDGRQGLAGAGAGAAADAHPSGGYVGNTAASTRGPSGLSDIGNTKSSAPDTTCTTHEHNRDALAGATAAFAVHEHSGHGHTFVGDPCQPNESTSRSGAGFTHGPHATDTANRLDPHLHVPGEFPDSTPAEERTQPSLSQHQHPQSTEVAGAGLPSESQRHHQAGATAEDPASKTVGPHKSNIANVLDPRVLPDPAKQKDHTTTGPHQSDTLNRLDPKVDSQAQSQEQKHHYGRDAAVVGGAGAAGLGTYEAGKHHSREPQNIGSASGPSTSHHATGLGEQRYNPTTTSAPANTHDGSGHHYGRDAAIVGGTGAAEYGASEAAQKHAGHHNTGPAAFMDGQRNDPAVHQSQHPAQPQHEHHYGRDVAIASGVGAAGAGTYAAIRHEKDRSDPISTSTTAQQPTSSQHPTTSQAPHGHHYGRDAAIAGGVGAAGAGTYAATRHEKDGSAPLHQSTGYQQPVVSQQPTTSQAPHGHHYGRDAAIAGGVGAAGAGTYAATRHEKDKSDPISRSTEAQQPIGTHQRYDSAADPTDPHHKKRDAALAGAGAGAAGAGAYEYSKHHAEDERLAQQKLHDKELEKQNKEAEAQQKKDQKAFEKEHKKEEKHAAAAAAAAEKKHQKEAEKEEKKHEREVEKEEKKRQKEAEAAELKHQKQLEEREKKDEKEHEKEEEKEKKHHLLGFLHRDKKDKEDEEHTSPTTAGATDAHEHDHGKDRHRLHKDPPPGHPAREPLQSGFYEHMGTDGPIGRRDMVSGDHETTSGGYGAHKVDE